jgi:hypothetical protein
MLNANCFLVPVLTPRVIRYTPGLHWTVSDIKKLGDLPIGDCGSFCDCTYVLSNNIHSPGTTSRIETYSEYRATNLLIESCNIQPSDQLIHHHVLHSIDHFNPFQSLDSSQT